MKKPFLLTALLLCTITPGYFAAQNLPQELQNFTVKLQHIIKLLIQPIQPSKPIEQALTPLVQPLIEIPIIPPSKTIELTAPTITKPSKPFEPPIIQKPPPIEIPFVPLITQPIQQPAQPPNKPGKPTEIPVVQQPTQPIPPSRPTIQPGKPISPPITQPTGPVKPTSVSIKGPDFVTWKNICGQLPKYAKGKKPEGETALEFEIFTQTLESYFATMKPILENQKNWLHNAMPDTSTWNNDPILVQRVIMTKRPSDAEEMFYDTLPFIPFAQKITFKPTDRIAFHGDFHGDIHACNNFIQTWIDAKYMDNNFKIIKDNFYIIFLGDYTDRGWYGAEIIYTLLQLKIANPAHVFMVRGNHEDLDLINEYGFIDELHRKFHINQARTLLKKITRFYNFLPMVFYFSCPRSSEQNDTIQCCHGGIEIGYNPQPFLASMAQFAYIPTFMRADNYSIIQSNVPGFTNDMQNNVPATTTNGFMWSDFIVEGKQEIVPSNRGKGIFAYGQLATKALLLVAWKPIKQSLHETTHTLRAIFRAHQHVGSDVNPMKQIILNFNKTKPDTHLTAPWYKAPKEDAGIAFLWSESDTKKAGSLQNIYVLTFSVSPETPYDWPYDAFGLLTLAEDYNTWNMKVYRKPDPILKKE